MPHKDQQDRRRYDRDRKRRLRAEARAAALALPHVEPDRVGAVEGLQALLAEAVARIRRDHTARDIDKGRELGRLVSVALRLLETRDLAERLEALERVVERRRV